MSPNRNKVLAVVVLVAGCSRTPAQPPGQTGTTTVPPAIVAWLDCVECTNGELNAVQQFGDAAVPELRTILLKGPSGDRLNQERQHLEAAYRAMKDYERQNPNARVPLNEQEYVKLYLGKYVLRNRTRAAVALGRIKTVNARNALIEARKEPNLPDEVLREIELALK
jgi:HEAT repeat protein